ncbi:MAG: ABC transporter ATP-binding protein, partial [Oscillospiraceae bacterium]|nr:ABC transporter ATP-binding protein [Oscillospiraceae bacterium]
SVGIIGNNGAGKSTLLKMVTGVCFPTSGSVTVNGSVAALLELTAGFSAEMTGRENIRLKGNILGLSETEIDLIEDRVIEFADLGEYIDQPVRTYSSGMSVRLGFAINISIEPEILVVDEALSVGDASFRRKCKEKVDEIKHRGVTVLYVSHAQESIKDFCDRAIYLEKGSLVYDGSVEEALKLYRAALAKRTPGKGGKK